MLKRCENPNYKEFRFYGGRGIKVCERWHSFDNFLADMSECPINLSIERIDNAKGYEPGNCRWATRTEQGRNMRSNRLITVHGQTRCAVEWAEIYGVAASTICRRLGLGWSDEEAVMTPVRRDSRHIKPS